MSVLGFISKASETVDQLAIGIGELSHLTVEGLEMGVDYVTGHQTPQWIKDDITGATNNLLAASEFTDSLLALDAEAWGAVGKELGKIGTDFVTAVKTGDDYALGGYVFDVATLVGPASISKLKYVDEASALTKLTETSEVASTVGKVEDGVKVVDRKQFSLKWQNLQKAFPNPKLEQSIVDDILNIKVNVENGEFRPSPRLYLSTEYIEQHKSLFDEGVAAFARDSSNLERFSQFGRDDGAFVFPQKIADAMVEEANGNPRVLENLLGLDEGSLGDNPIMLHPTEVNNLRVPSGNESGARNNLQWRPGGLTYPGGVPESVIDPVTIDKVEIIELWK